MALAKALAVFLALLAGLDRMRSGTTCLSFNFFPINCASFLPLLFRGLSKSSRLIFFQLDLACLTRISVFILNVLHIYFKQNQQVDGIGFRFRKRLIPSLRYMAVTGQWAKNMESLRLNLHTPIQGYELDQVQRNKILFSINLFYWQGFVQPFFFVGHPSTLFTYKFWFPDDGE